MKQLNKLVKHDLVRGLKNVIFEKDKLCSVCQAGKQVGNTHPKKSIMSTSKAFELLYMDLFGPTTYTSIGGNKYGFVIVDDFIRYTWIVFLVDKSDVFATFKSFIKRVYNEFGKMMANEFEMSMIGELSYFLGLQIKHLKNGTFVSQGKYIKDMLKKFGIEDAKRISTPMGTNRSLDSDTSGNMMDQKMYRSMIKSLLYVTALRLDVMFSVCICARFQASLRESHLKATKRTLRYLKYTQNVGLCYPKGAKFELIGYFDSDYVGCIVHRRSTLDTCQLLERSLVSWSSKKQNSVTLSTAKAEYIAISSCCAQILWIKATLNDFGIKFKQVPLLCDNESAVKLTNNPVQHAGTKHIDVHHHFIRDHQQKEDISIENVGTNDQLAGIFTKSLDEKKFCKLRNELNILDFSNMCLCTPIK
jgi:hypothetical protein